MPIVLGHDPSLASYGLALVDTDGPSLLAHAVIVTTPTQSRAQRLRTLYSGLRLRIERWQESWAIDCAAFEAGMSFAGSPHGIIAQFGIAEARGVGQLAASHLDCTSLAPSAIRKAVAGSGRAKKPEAVAAVCRILGMATLPPDAADAAAAALAVGGFSVSPSRSSTSVPPGVPSPRKRRRTKAGQPATPTATHHQEV